MRQWKAHDHRGIWALAFSLDGRLLATASQAEVAVWNPAVTDDNRLVQRFATTRTFSAACAWTARELVTAAGGSVTLVDWASKSDRQIHLDEHRDGGRGVQTVTVSPDGRWLIAGLCGRLFRLDLAHPDLAPVEWTLGGSNSLYHSFSPDGQLLATARDAAQIVLWNTADWSEHAVIETADKRRVDAHGVEFHRDGRTLLVARGNGVVESWDAETGERLRQWTGHRSFALQGRWHPDGRAFATCGSDGTVRLWVGDHCTVYDWGLGQVNRLAFAPDGLTLAVGTYNGHVVIQDVEL